jgi:hypothetical protein
MSRFIIRSAVFLIGWLALVPAATAGFQVRIMGADLNPGDSATLDVFVSQMGTDDLLAVFDLKFVIEPVTPGATQQIEFRPLAAGDFVNDPGYVFYSHSAGPVITIEGATNDALLVSDIYDPFDSGAAVGSSERLLTRLHIQTVPGSPPPTGVESFVVWLENPRSTLLTPDFAESSPVASAQVNILPTSANPVPAPSAMLLALLGVSSLGLARVRLWLRGRWAIQTDATS